MTEHRVRIRSGHHQLELELSAADTGFMARELQAWMDGFLGQQSSTVLPLAAPLVSATGALPENPVFNQLSTPEDATIPGSVVIPLPASATQVLDEAVNDTLSEPASLSANVQIAENPATIAEARIELPTIEPVAETLAQQAEAAKAAAVEPAQAVEELDPVAAAVAETLAQQAEVAKAAAVEPAPAAEELDPVAAAVAETLAQQAEVAKAAAVEPAPVVEELDPVAAAVAETLAQQAEAAKAAAVEPAPVVEELDPVAAAVAETLAQQAEAAKVAAVEPAPVVEELDPVAAAVAETLAQQAEVAKAAAVEPAPVVEELDPVAAAVAETLAQQAEAAKAAAVEPAQAVEELDPVAAAVAETLAQQAEAAKVAAVEPAPVAEELDPVAAAVAETLAQQAEAAKAAAVEPAPVVEEQDPVAAAVAETLAQQAEAAAKADVPEGFDQMLSQVMADMADDSIEAETLLAQALPGAEVSSTAADASSALGSEVDEAEAPYPIGLIDALADLCDITHPETPLATLQVAAYYLTVFDQRSQFNLKQINAQLLMANESSISHSILAQAIDGQLLALVPDPTGALDSPEYVMTATTRSCVDEWLKKGAKS
jgi:hypothetical protein